MTTRISFLDRAPPGDVAVFMPREKQARSRTRDASILTKYGRGARLRTGATLQPAGTRMTLPGGALIRQGAEPCVALRPAAAQADGKEWQREKLQVADERYERKQGHRDGSSGD